MLKQFLILVVIGFLFGNVARSDTGGTLGDVDFDGKVGLKEAIYALKVVTGIHDGERTLEEFQVYRSEVHCELKNLARMQYDYAKDTGTFASDLSDIESNWRFPDMSLNVLEADDEHFVLSGGHHLINGYTWTYNENFQFIQNGILVDPEMELWELYRNEVITVLGSVFFGEQAYYTDNQKYTQDIMPIVGDVVFKMYPKVDFSILELTDDHFILQGLHTKLNGYRWTLDSERNIRVERR